MAPQLDTSSAGELLSELVRYGLQGVIELRVTAVSISWIAMRPLIFYMGTLVMNSEL